MSGAFQPIADVLRIDCAAESARIEQGIREIIAKRLKRKGAVVALSGGIDSSVVAALCCRALGGHRVFGLMMPEADSSPESNALGRLLAHSLGIQARTEDITPILAAAGCYRRRDDAIRKLVPEYGEGFRSKIVQPSPDEKSAYPIFSLVVESPDGRLQKVRLSYESYMGIVAATNLKQRTRKMLEYYFADLLGFAVAGTPNRVEYDQGFFVKNGDGAADLKPIAHLYKSQVFQLAEYLNIPEEIRRRPPTTDTYSLPQSQEEFYFVLPLDRMDLCLYGQDHGIPPAELAPLAEMTEDQVARAYAASDARRRAAIYLHAPPVLVQPLERDRA
jgi:NAD+ synthase